MKTELPQNIEREAKHTGLSQHVHLAMNNKRDASLIISEPNRMTLYNIHCVNVAERQTAHSKLLNHEVAQLLELSELYYRW